MSEAIVRRCDNPTCRVEIPVTEGFYEIRAMAIRYRPGHQRGREAMLVREACSHACVLATVSTLIRLIDGREAEPCVV